MKYKVGCMTCGGNKNRVKYQPANCYMDAVDILESLPKFPKSFPVESRFVRLLVCTSEITVLYIHTESGRRLPKRKTSLWKSEHHQQKELLEQQIFLHDNRESESKILIRESQS